MATRAKLAVQDVGISTQLGLFEVLEAESAEPGRRTGEKARVDGAAGSRSSSSTICLRGVEERWQQRESQEWESSARDSTSSGLSSRRRIRS